MPLKTLHVLLNQMNCLKFPGRSTAVILFLFSVQSVMAQFYNSNDFSEYDSLVSWSQGYYGIDDELVNGFVYALPDPTIQGHPYLYNKWEEGTLFIHGKMFRKIPSKYDLVKDEMVIKVRTGENIERILSVSKQQVDSILLDNALFVNSRYFFQEETEPAFYHVIFSGNLSLVKKYEKRFIGIYNSSAPGGKFSDLKSKILLFNGEQFISVDSKKSFIRYFGKSRKKEITHFLRQNKINYKNATSGQLVILINFCSQNLHQ